MGQKLLNSSWFRFAFLRQGYKDAFFRLDGTTASVIDMLTSLVITGIKSRRHSLRTVAGIGSRSHDSRLNLVTNFSSCISETGMNCRNKTLLCSKHASGKGSCSIGLLRSRSALTVLIFSNQRIDSQDLQRNCKAGGAFQSYPLVRFPKYQTNHLLLTGAWSSSSEANFTLYASTKSAIDAMSLSNRFKFLMSSRNLANSCEQVLV